jgi:carbamoylphosphate synthase large subunit
MDPSQYRFREQHMHVVLLGAGGTGTSFAIASRLRAHWGAAIRLIITDSNPPHLVTTSLLADACVRVPYANDPGFAALLADLIEREGVQTYIPILNDEIVLAARLQAEPRWAHVDFWSSPLHAQCVDKVFADRWLQGIGVRTPATIAVDELAHGDGPWFAKPRRGFGSRGAGIVSGADLRRLDEIERDALIVQELCRSPEVTVDSFYDAATGVGHAYCRERIETKAGVCTKARIFRDAELEAFAVAIGRALGQRGTICFQAMQGDGGWAVTDLNLRSGAGTAMTCAAGFDVLAAAWACRRGEAYDRFLPPLEEGRSLFVTRQYAEFVMA